jgi:hypothetical protein
MTELASQNLKTSEDGQPPGTADDTVAIGQTGASLFPELVWAHFIWEKQLDQDNPDEALEAAYRTKLKSFEDCEGKLISAYWSTYRASATALTEKPQRVNVLKQIFGVDDSVMRLHRVSDWATRDAEPIAHVLQHCDALAIRVSQVLRGPPERIAMQLIASVAKNLLGYVDRKGGKPQPMEARRFAAAQEEELHRIETFYDRAGTKAGRLVYFRGMVIGACILVPIMAALALLFLLFGFWDEEHTQKLQYFYAAATAGALGALVSVLQRMSSPTGAFRIDYEVGRAAITRLGAFRPFIGAIFGLAAYFLFEGGLVTTELTDLDQRAFYFYGSIAFLAGFSERWTQVMVGGARRMIPPPPPARDQDEEEEEAERERSRAG